MTAPDVRAERSIVEPINDLELIEHLDFEHTPQCEHSGHGSALWANEHEGPAYVMVQVSCPLCSFGRVIMLCQTYWNVILAGATVNCPGCDHRGSGYSFYTPLGWVE